jgi:hypothetical protein
VEFRADSLPDRLRYALGAYSGLTGGGAAGFGFFS